MNVRKIRPCWISCVKRLDTMVDNRFCTPVPSGYVIFSGILTVNRSVEAYFKDKKAWNSNMSKMSLNPNCLKNGLPQEIVLSEEGDYGRKDMQTLFYEGVVNSVYPSPHIRINKSYKYIRHYRIDINKDIPLFDKEVLMVSVKSIEFYILSEDRLLYTIETDVAGKTLEQISLQNRVIRNVECYQFGHRVDAENLCNLNDGFLKLFLPIIEIHNRYNKANLPTDDYSQVALKNFAYDLFRGNKLSAYMAVQLPEDCNLLADSYTVDNLLYELATCSKMGLMLEPQNKDYPDLQYYNELVKNNMFACYSNWKAIALLDSFVVVFKSGYNINSSWRACYFQYLYINALCIRSFLVIMNEKYKRKDMTESVESDFLDFDKAFNFQKVGYTFLTNLIYKKIRYGLQIDDELQVLEDKICKFSDKQDRKNENNTNNILFFLAILALFSAFTDAFQLFKDIEVFKLFNINLEGNELLLVKHIYFIILLLLIVLCVLYKVKNRIIHWIKSIFYL